jgi:hypothetical protein
MILVLLVSVRNQVEWQMPAISGPRLQQSSLTRQGVGQKAGGKKEKKEKNH